MTKAQTRCRVSRGLVNGLCVRHARAAVAPKTPEHPCTVLMTRGPRAGEPCGLVAIEGDKCRRHATSKSSKEAIPLFVMLVSRAKKMTECVGPFTDLEVCLEQARQLFADYPEWEEYTKDEVTAPAVAYLSSPRDGEQPLLTVKIAQMTPAQEPEGCTYVFGRGANKGERCGKKVHASSLCTAHFRKHAEEAAQNRCVYTFGRGARKGERCNNKIRAQLDARGVNRCEGSLLCAKHAEPRPPTPLMPVASPPALEAPPTPCVEPTPRAEPTPKRTPKKKRNTKK